MRIINNALELKATIDALEKKDTLLQEELTIQYHATANSLTPGNMLKSALHKIIPSNGVGGVLKTAGSLGLGLLGSRLTGGLPLLSGNNIAGSLAKMIATKSVMKNTGKFSAYGKAIYHNFFKKKDE